MNWNNSIQWPNKKWEWVRIKKNTLRLPLQAHGVSKFWIESSSWQMRHSANVISGASSSSVSSSSTTTFSSAALDGPAISWTVSPVVTGFTSRSTSRTKWSSPITPPIKTKPYIKSNTKLITHQYPNLFPQIIQRTTNKQTLKSNEDADQYVQIIGSRAKLSGLKEKVRNGIEWKGEKTYLFGMDEENEKRVSSAGEKKWPLFLSHLNSAFLFFWYIFFLLSRRLVLFACKCRDFIFVDEYL